MLMDLWKGGLKMGKWVDCYGYAFVHADRYCSYSSSLQNKTMS